MAAKKKSAPEQITIPEIRIDTLRLKIIGDSPLICHRWAEKAKKAMRDKQMKVAKGAREAKDPKSDFEESLYPHPSGGYGFPAVAFKSAAVSATRFVEDMKMTELRGALHIVGDLVKIEGKPTPREDMVRVGMGSADIRYRGEFLKWSAELIVQFNSRFISAAQIVNIFNNAGFGVGVGEWRPEKNGSFGRFHVERKAARP